MIGRQLSFLLLLPVIAVAALALSVACSDDDEPEASASASPESTMAMDDDHEDEDEDHEESFTFGHAADAADADRTIEIEALDTLKFEPEATTVKVGETVTFKVHNAGQLRHEFVLGTEDDQADHEQEMQEMMESGMAMHDDPNGFGVDPGETKELTWTFTEAGTVVFGCHEPGHYAAGMKGELTVG